MKKSRGASAKYRRQIKKLARIRRGQGTTHERTFIDNAIAALQDGDTIEAVTYLKYCFNSVNLKVGEEKEIQNMVKTLSPRMRDRVVLLSQYFRPILLSLSQEIIVFIIIVAAKAIYEILLSIYWLCYGYNDYRRTTSPIIKSFSCRITCMGGLCT